MSGVNGANCTHCQKSFKCGCQKTTNDNNEVVHKGCVNASNAIIRTQNANQTA
jgi:hypothetical protein